MQSKSDGTIKRFLQGWVITTLAVLLADVVLPGIHSKTSQDLLLASFLLGGLNAFVRPLLMLVALPLLIFTLGLFVFVINAFLLLLVGYIVSGFEVDDFWAAFFGSLIISFVSLVLNALTDYSRSRIHVQRSNNQPRPPADNGGGPVIDV